MLFVDKEQVKVTKFPNGELLVDTTLLRKVKDILKDINSKEDFIEIPVINKTPEDIDM